MGDALYVYSFRDPSQHGLAFIGFTASIKKMAVDRLDYDTHRLHYEAVFGVNLGDFPPEGGQSQKASYAMVQALNAHAIAVHDPLRDLFFEVVRFARSLSSQDAMYYMLYGAGRRMNMIFYEYNKIVWNAPVDRTRPLSREEQNSLNAAINTIYMHLLGVLDNFVLSILYEKEEVTMDLNPRNIYLFSNTLEKLESFKALHRELHKFRQWVGDVKTRRNPVAHRIPLQLLHAVVRGKEADQHRTLIAQFYEACNTLDFARAEQIQRDIENVGNFWPCFTHHPDEGVMPLYPTLPTDMANLIRIGHVVFALLKGGE